MKSILLVIGVTIVAILIYVFFGNTISVEDIKRKVSPTASIYTNAKSVSNQLKFINDEREPIDLAKLDNKWLMLYFGYTSCPDVCPIDMAVANQAFINMNNKNELQVIFVSIDPKRDMGKMQQYASAFNPQFMGITLKDDDLTKLTKSLGVYSEIVNRQKQAEMHYARAKNHNSSHSASKKHDSSKHEHNDNYLINHTASYLLLNHDRQLVALFSSPHIPAKTAKALDIIIDNLR